MFKKYMSNFNSALHSVATFNASPAKLGAAAFVGTVVGVSPFYGFHLVLCVAFSFLFRLNAILTYAAANISNPFFAPLLTFMSYQIGSYLLTGEWGTLSWDAVKADPSSIFKSWLVGSLILGSILGTILGVTVYILSRAWKTPDVDAVALKTSANLVANAAKPYGRFASGYARGKILGDPVYRTLLERIPKDTSVLDLGGGQGFLALLLALKHGPSSFALTVLDHDKKKIAQGKTMAEALGVPITFQQGDARAPLAKTYDVICIIDVLHYFVQSEQDALLKAAVSALNPDGVLFVRDIDFDRSTRSWLNYLQETFSLFFGITQANALHPRNKAQLLNVLNAHGFAGTTEVCSGGLLYRNMLLTARRTEKQTSPNPC